MELKYRDTPIASVSNHLTEEKGVKLFIKREDLNHPAVSGNKWWKLKYNLEAAIREGKDTLLTFGGAYSNHIYATAAAANVCGLKSIGIIRGEETTPINRTLSFAQRQGMTLHYVSRTFYRTKSSRDFIEALSRRFGDFFLVPEGGTNVHAIRGCREFGERLLESEFDYVVLPVGTGGTIAGLIAAFQGRRSIIGVPVFKNSDYLIGEIQELLRNAGELNYDNWKLLTRYHCGGYAKTTPSLIQLITEVERSFALPVEPVYTGKMMMGIFEEIKNDTFARGSKILALHTGGLQSAAD